MLKGLGTLALGHMGAFVKFSANELLFTLALNNRWLYYFDTADSLPFLYKTKLICASEWNGASQSEEVSGRMTKQIILKVRVNPSIDFAGKRGCTKSS